MHRMITSGAVFAAMLASGADHAVAGRSSFVATHYGRPHTLVAVQGRRRLNLTCVGRGKPTVLFLSGLGGGTFDWRKVQPAVGKVTRACAYDRAGYGFSDPATAPSDLTNTIADLNRLIHSAAIAVPVILVGHSLGGVYATSYALRYRNDVGGMVLVDPAFRGQAGKIAEAVGPTAASGLQAANGRTLASIDTCVALAESGRLSAPAEHASDCLDNPPDPDPDVHHERDREAKTAAFQHALRSEFVMANIGDADGATADDRQGVRSGRALGAMPVAILTRGNSEALSGLSADEIVKAERAWRTGHDQLASLSAVGTNSIVPHAGHFIQLDQPETVTKRILLMVNTVRGGPQSCAARQSLGVRPTECEVHR